MTDLKERQDSTPWWLWPNVLNLDAPVVAVVWQDALARMVGANLSWPHHWLMALAVWEVYFLDRWLDARHGAHEATDRHRFHGRVRTSGMAVAVMAAIAGGALAARCLNGAGWLYAMIVIATTGVWFLVTHLRRGAGRFLPKELSVGIIFATGCLVQPLSLAPDGFAPGHAAICGLLFAWLCFQNCAAITVWESLPTDQDDPRSLLNGWGGTARWFPRLGFAHMTVSGLVIALAPPELGRLVCALLLSSMALFALNAGARACSPRALRALADIALLTPLIFLI